MPRTLLALALAAALAACSRPYVAGGIGPADDSPVPIRDRYARARLDLLAAVNQDRRAAGIAPVRLDSLASVVAQAHAEAMAWGGFFSHYGVDGQAPFERLAAAGGTTHVRENIFRYEEGTGSPRRGVEAWDGFDVRDAERWLMGSPGHRAAILDPARTGVGLGLAASPDGRSVFVVQEFVARYAEIAVDPGAWRRAAPRIEGRVPAPGLRPLLVVLHRRDELPAWVARGGKPPGGPYLDGAGAATVLPPWAIEWRPGDRSFAFSLPPAGRAGRRTYGIVYVAPRTVVEGALARRSADTRQGWPGAAFVIDAL